MKVYSLRYEYGDLTKLLKEVDGVIGIENVNNFYVRALNNDSRFLFIVTKYHKDFMLLSLKYGTSAFNYLPKKSLRLKINKSDWQPTHIKGTNL